MDPDCIREQKQFRRDFKNIFLIAHRGMGPTNKLPVTGAQFLLRQRLPAENTIESLTEALNYVPDGIEFDVFLNKDNEPVVIHDDQLWRNVYDEGVDRFVLEHGDVRGEGKLSKVELETRRVSKKSFEELQQFAVGPRGEKIPLLKTVLELCAYYNQDRKENGLDNLRINVELKTPDLKEERSTLQKNLVGETFKVISTFTEGEMLKLDDFYFITYEQEIVIEIRKINNDVKISLGKTTDKLFTGELKKSPTQKTGYVTHPTSATSYKSRCLDEWNHLRTNSPHVHAFDMSFWDIFKPLIDYATANSIPIHACTSEYRNYEKPPAFKDLLMSIVRSEIPEFFYKCDDVNLFRKYITDKRNDTVEIPTVPVSRPHYNAPDFASFYPNGALSEKMLEIEAAGQKI